MKIAIMQPYFLPYIGYFQLISAVDEFVFFDDVQYINKGWINRNRILNGADDLLFTIPLHKSPRGARINQRTISNQWCDQRIKLLKTIECTYSNAPYFDLAYDLIDHIFHYEEDKLADYVTYSIHQISKYLGIKTSFLKSSSYHLDDEFKGELRILELCNQLGADHYVNPIGGLELYSAELFDTHGINLSFLKTKNIEYSQFSHTFVPNLSIIDVIMFNSVDKISDFIEAYELVSA